MQSPPLIDTHAHLDDEQLRGDVPGAIERAQSAGVIRIVTVATSALSTQSCIELASRHSFLKASAGIHPNHAAEAGPADWDSICRMAADQHVAAIGETGLDRHWDDTPFPMQEDYFARHLALSRLLRKPLIIHCREAEADVLRMLRDDHDRHGPILGIMHSFTGELALAQACLAMGLYISFAGMLTYKKSQALRDVAAQLPLDRLLVETDSPYLAPVPMRGQRNEPANVVHTTACLATVREVPLEEVAKRTTENARRLLGL